MSPPVKLVFRIAYRGYKVGDIITPTAMLRGQYLALRVLGQPVCEVVAEPPPEPVPPARGRKRRES